jgi:hypothetical protein
VNDEDVKGKKTKTILSWAQPTASVKGQIMEKSSSKYLPVDKGRVFINGDIACG